MKGFGNSIVNFSEKVLNDELSQSLGFVWKSPQIERIEIKN